MESTGSDDESLLDPVYVPPGNHPSNLVPPAVRQSFRQACRDFINMVTTQRHWADMNTALVPLMIACVAVVFYLSFISSGPKPPEPQPFPKRFGSVDSHAIRELQRVYQSKILPVEQKYQLFRFDLPEVTEAELRSLPVVLLLGQYSTGKTSFIRHMIGMDYPDIHISPEPSTDKFTAVVHGATNQTINGHLLVDVRDLPFAGLQKFGDKFLEKFGAAVVPAPTLQKFHFLDTPGVLSGEKQRLQRGYDYASVAKWLAARSDLILLFFDCSKLDISDEYRSVIEALLPYENRVKWVLNKADEMDQATLMRVFGAVMGTVRSAFRTVENPRVYVGSFHDKPLTHPEHRALFDDDRAHLLKLFDRLPTTSVMRKVSELQKRIRRVQAHLCLMDHLRSKMPMFYGWEARQRRLIDTLPTVFEEVRLKYFISEGDLPDLAEYAEQLEKADFRTFPALDKRVYKDLKDLLDHDMARIAQMVVPVSGEQDANV